MRPKRTEITVETSQVYVFSRAARPTLAWCARCAAEVFAVTAEVAAALAAPDSREPPGPDPGEAIHFTEPRAGEPPLVCLNSLRAATPAPEAGPVRDCLSLLRAAADRDS